MKLTPDMILQIKEDVLDGIMPIPDGLIPRATKGLFWEHRHASKCVAYYNLSARDHDGTLSMYQIYMQCSSEYEAAIVLLGSIQQWRKLCMCTWFQDYLTQWRYDMSVRDEAVGKAVVYHAALFKGDVQSGKVLLNNKNKPSRPAKGNGRIAPKAKPNAEQHTDDVDAFLQAGTEAINEQRKH